MAEKRMLSRKITENDNFVTLPATAQALYMHLNLSADDDGFCNQIETAMFRAHAKKKDLQLLLDRRYLLQFESGVICIKHWRMANAGRSDRYTPTAYQEEFARLTVKPNKAYTLATKRQPECAPDGGQDDNQMTPKRQPNDYRLEPQKRIEENRREENRRVNSACAHARTREDEKDDGFSAFWNAYPRKSGDIRQAYLAYQHALEVDGVDPSVLVEAIKAQTDGVTTEDVQYMPSAEKWLRNMGWESKASFKRVTKETKPKRYSTAAEYKEQQQKQQIDAEAVNALISEVESWAAEGK